MKKNPLRYLAYALCILLAAVFALNLAPVSCYRISSSGSVPAFAAGYALADINTAGFKELEATGGIGSVTAAAIIKYREKHGPFEKMDDLGSVSGLTPARLTKLKAKFKVGNK